jgi:MFS transporter, ACS family, tartrate transporter
MDAGVISNETIGKSFMNKAFWRILPLILIAHLFAYMDRFNVSFVAAA